MGENTLQKILEEAGYSISPTPSGYLTRKERLSVDKVIRVSSFFRKNKQFRDGFASELFLRVMVYDSEKMEKIGSFDSMGRSTGRLVNLRKIPGGKVLYKEILKDPSKVDQVPEFLGKDPKKVKAILSNKNIYILEGDESAMLKENLLNNLDFRKAIERG